MFNVPTVGNSNFLRSELTTISGFTPVSLTLCWLKYCQPHKNSAKVTHCFTVRLQFSPSRARGAFHLKLIASNCVIYHINRIDFPGSLQQQRSSSSSTGMWNDHPNFSQCLQGLRCRG